MRIVVKLAASITVVDKASLQSREFPAKKIIVIDVKTISLAIDIALSFPSLIKREWLSVKYYGLLKARPNEGHQAVLLLASVSKNLSAACFADIPSETPNLAAKLLTADTSPSS